MEKILGIFQSTLSEYRFIHKKREKNFDFFLFLSTEGVEGGQIGQSLGDMSPKKSFFFIHAVP